VAVVLKKVLDGDRRSCEIGDEGRSRSAEADLALRPPTPLLTVVAVIGAGGHL
jgi:hypothetical protein